MSRPTALSREGLLQIMQREAFVPTAYHDGWFDKAKTKPRYSIGFGDNDPKLKPGDTIGFKEAIARFKMGVAQRTAYVLKKLHVDVTQQQLDALVSLYYQGGNKKLLPVVKLMNGGKMHAAELKFLDPSLATTAHDEFHQGLQDRRNRERAIFAKGDYGDIGWFWKYTGDPKDGKRQKYFVKDGDL